MPKYFPSYPSSMFFLIAAAKTQEPIHLSMPVSITTLGLMKDYYYKGHMY